jgi:hypothetical protein
MSVKYFWLFLTERCNLGCDYCFYKDRDGRTSLSPSNVARLLEIPVSGGTEFVLSGGEPLMEWDLTKEAAAMIRGRFPGADVLVQSNGTLLDAGKISYLKKAGISIELGLDGGLLSTSRHRKGAEGFYDAIVRNAVRSRRAGMKITATLTVHPHEAGMLFENFMQLLKLGIPAEVTPAAFEEWDARSAAAFKKQYLDAVRFAIAGGCPDMLKCGYDAPLTSKIIDIVPAADGSVLTNWSLLSLPREKRKKYAIMRLKGGKLVKRPRAMAFFSRLYGEAYSSENFTYREFSSLNAKLVSKELGNDANFGRYLDVCGFMKKVNQRLLLKLSKHSA